jgi:hypothetical protein
VELISIRHDVDFRRGMDPGKCIANRKPETGGSAAWRSGPVSEPRSSSRAEDNHGVFSRGCMLQFA